MVDTSDIQTKFDNTFTRQFGFPKERPATKVKSFLTRELKEFIAMSPFLVMATSAPDGSCDASPKGGKPGFVKVLDDASLLIPGVAGNKLFQSYQNVEQNPHVGLLFFIPGERDTARVNGTAEILDAQELEKLRVQLEVSNPDDNSKVLQGLLVHVEESYGHCPRALAFSELWSGSK